MRANETYSISLTTGAQKSLSEIPKKYAGRILASIDQLRTNPLQGKRLAGGLKNSFSIRVWPYRVIYVFEKDVLRVIVVKVGHRQGVYK